MFAWIASNFYTILICLVLIAIVALIIRSMVKEHQRLKKSAGSGCGSGCAGCAYSKKCHGGSVSS